MTVCRQEIRYFWTFSDLSRIERINEKQFVEYTKDEYPTTFTITWVEPCKRWEFDMETAYEGYWIGIFTEIKGYKEVG